MPEQLRQSFLYRLPHDIEVDVEIAVGHAIAHIAPRHTRMRLRKLSVVSHYLCCDLAYDDQAHPEFCQSVRFGRIQQINEFRVAELPDIRSQDVGLAGALIEQMSFMDSPQLCANLLDGDAGFDLQSPDTCPS